MALETEPQHEFSRRLAAHAGLPFLTLEREPDDGSAEDAVNPSVARALSESLCRHFQVLAVGYRNGCVMVACREPLDETGRSVVSALAGHPVSFAIAPAEEIERAIDRTFSVDYLAPHEDTYQELPDQLAEELEWERADPDGPAPAPTQAGHDAVGQALVTRGLVTRQQLDWAMDQQERNGCRLGEILVHAGLVAENALVQALAEEFRVPLAPLDDVEPGADALAQVPEPVARELRCVPLAIVDEVLYLATADLLDDATVARLREHTDLRLAPMLASKGAIDGLLQRIHGRAYVEIATSELMLRHPENSASRVVTPAQKYSLIGMTAAFLLFLVIFPLPTLIVAFGTASVYYIATSLYKLRLTFRALGHEYELDITDEDVAALDERTLPMYTILVPLFREAEVVPRLAAGIDRLDYPKPKLDVRLLCEEGDDETIEAVRAMNLPPHFKLVIVPDAEPKTKPKACNYGLLQAEGEYVVIYDAEDRPDPDQLKKVVLAFRRAEPNIACVQAKLNYFNQNQNLLTRFFAIEYSMWFDLVLPGLDAGKVPIPLGGTSNHFIRERLVELGAWDPFNVTEDADLGVRLHKAGYRTAIVDSTTLEEANSRVGNWVRQRSRWIKGYILTWLVHMRHPVRLMRELGFRGWLSFQLIVGGAFIFLLNPIFWLLTGLYFIGRVHSIGAVFPGWIFYVAATELFIGNFLFVYLNVAGAVQRRYYDLAKYALLSPLYWGLMSIAAWKGFIQLFTKPFFWEKTVHGLDGQSH